MVESNGWESVEAEINVDDLVFQDVDNLQHNTSTKHSPTNINENKEINEEVKLNNIDPIEIVSDIIPYGKFEIDREEVKDGIEYIVIRCSDPESNATIGWYYLQNEAVVVYSANDIQNLTEALCKDDITNNCIILQYEPEDDNIYHEILIFKDDNTVQIFSRFDYDMFGYSGDHIRVDYKISPN